MDKANDAQIIQLPPGMDSLSEFNYVSTRYDVRVPLGVEAAELLKPAFWAHHAAKLKPYDEIRARAEDGSWIADYIVTDCSRTWAKVSLKALHQLTTADVAISQASESEVKAFIDAHSITYRGAHKFCVVRKADSAVLLEGAQKDDAKAWLEKHAREQVGAQAKPKQSETAAA